jgi:hypothetical protein
MPNSWHPTDYPSIGLLPRDQNPGTGGSARAVDTALVSQWMARSYPNTFVISTYCALCNSTVPSGIRALGLTHTGAAPLTTERRTWSGYGPNSTVPLGIRVLGLTHTGTAPLTTERRTWSGSVPSVRFLCVGQTSTSFSAFTFSSHYCDSPARLFTSSVRRQPHSTSSTSVRGRIP